MGQLKENTNILSNMISKANVCYGFDCVEEAAWLALSIANTFHGLLIYY